ncbi:hypothetical protein MNBD_GAMMA23-418 [hydrothermal vent metagenome]|uniref:CAAX prenyl protease 2/Lysostaphin resistance protein A-like domain-containing protein n=1 Tax=hydrothermal vent metagenome TaxID=652676 RepID=A0A3B0ZYJ2_9ZZZZ
MKALHSTNTRSNQTNMFGLTITRSYWLHGDFWLACVAAVLFWSTFKLLALPLPIDITYPALSSTLLLLIIVFPVLEEIVFRGLIQESIHQLLSHNRLPTILLWRISSANLLTSLLFSASHLWTHSVLWALATLLPSLIFGYFKDQYQSLQASIMLHIFYNLGFYLFL